MTTLSYEMIAASKPFRFLVGPDKKEYMMHADLVATMSKALNVLVNGTMKEAREGVVEWPEVDESTFLNFWQFAYTRDYHISNSKLTHALKEDPQLGELKACESCFQRGISQCQCAPVNTSKLFKKTPVSNGFGQLIENQGKREGLWRKFIQDSGIETSEMTMKKGLSVNRAQDLLAHARVYTMADCYGIRSLAVSSSTKIHCSLATLLLDKISISQINHLIRYVFENTADRQCRLRNILCLFAASKLEDLWPTQEFQDLLLNSGEFSWGIIGHIVN